MGAEVMFLDIERFHDLIGDLDPNWIGRRDQMSLDSEPGLRFGIVDVVEDQVKRAQRTAGPGFTDFAEQPMFDWVPLRGAGWVMTDSYRQAQPIRQFVLKLLFEDTAPGGIRTAAIGFNEQVGRPRKALREFGLT